MPSGRNTVTSSQTPSIVLALSGGGAAGLAHIGVLQALVQNDIPVRAIAGTSIGAEIGAFFVTGMGLDDLATVATGFDWKQTLALFMPDLPTGGLISGVRIVEFLREQLGKRSIEDLTIGFAAVAADLETGEQVVLDGGDLVDAVRASISLPGLIAPFRMGGRSLVDGGVVNPLPFDVARQRFGGPVIAVGVHAVARAAGRSADTPRSPQWLERARQLLNQPWIAHAPDLRDWLRNQLDALDSRARRDTEWTTRRVLDRVLGMAQAEIVRLREAHSPADVLLLPKVDDIGVLEFYRADEAIAAGRAAAEAKLEQIKQILSTERG
jgi:NTE family protein